MMCFSNLQISKKQYSKKTILNLKFKFPANNSKVLWVTVIGRKFKFQAQDSFLEWFFFLRFGDLKNESHFLKKSHLYPNSCQYPLINYLASSSDNIGGTPCICSRQVWINWYPCSLKYCRNHEGDGEHRCGIKTCQKCLTFRYRAKSKLHCSWDEPWIFVDIYCDFSLSLFSPSWISNIPWNW